MKSFYGFLISITAAVLFILVPAVGIASPQESQEIISDYFCAVSYSTNVRYFGNSSLSGGYFGQNYGDDDVFGYDTKSPTKAFFLSLLVPGLGEYYAKSKYKPYVFFGADILLWTGHIIYHKKGKDGEDDFRAYADLHYDRDVYDEWWESLINNDPDTANTFSHRLPPEKNHEYYENIGKYDQFAIGWEPYDKNFNNPFRLHYMDMRADANSYFDKAKTMMIVSMVNHIVSGFDAAFTAKSYNTRGQSNFFSDVKIRMVPRTVDDDIFPQLTFYKKF